MSAAEPVWPDGGGYSESGNTWACPESGCGLVMAGLDFFDPEDPDPVGEHLAMHAREVPGRRLAVDQSGRVWLTDEGVAVPSAPARADDGIAVPPELAWIDMAPVGDSRTVPRHAAPSRRSSVMLGRVLALLALITLTVLVTVLVIVLTGGPASADAGVPHRWLAVQVLAWVLIVQGVVVLVVAMGVAALAGLERWYERVGRGAR